MSGECRARKPDGLRLKKWPLPPLILNLGRLKGKGEVQEVEAVSEVEGTRGVGESIIVF